MCYNYAWREDRVKRYQLCYCRCRSGNSFIRKYLVFKLVSHLRRILTTTITTTPNITTTIDSVGFLPFIYAQTSKQANSIVQDAYRQHVRSGRIAATGCARLYQSTHFPGLYSKRGNHTSPQSIGDNTSDDCVHSSSKPHLLQRLRRNMLLRLLQLSKPMWSN
ncbi:hypothetical protein L211DRAFT_841862 [Terfezia boudieri ATCC MYA-4762]|uniref:Uncharacterized protein n=1 Tax=Terfezia boudieri ATCC MYA-4762 TaxID=1051890 RepID=A0A3N4LBD0_9PEZI|nr:hypothetical protein L211DRAFT_841862 [Terfezia boudieri ATCC MYA-4762]